ncbi:PilN domain-containing protein [Hippea alviniae]|uniref:PilN domain-containing protein n=1 Tax=Hippea alviniae TaxID=1279027 RepID=UPI0003B49616|nr:PilN domain-containing protein [Hippea alviniae]
MIRINLLSGESEKKKSSKGVEVNINTKVVVIIVVFLVEFIALGVATYMLNGKLNNLKERRDKLANLEKRVNRIKAKIREVNRMVKVIKKLEQGRGNAAKLLAEVANSIPSFSFNAGAVVSSTVGDGLWFTRMRKKGNVLTIDGKSFSAEAVADYMIKLESLKDVKMVRFTGGGLRKILSKNGIDVYSFSIAITLKG